MSDFKTEKLIYRQDQILDFIQNLFSYFEEDSHLKSLSKIHQKKIKLALKEALNNSFDHGCCNENQPALIQVEANTQKVLIKIRDYGSAYSVKGNDFDLSGLYKSSGRGLLLIKNTMDSIRVKNLALGNILILELKLRQERNINMVLELFENLNEMLLEEKSQAEIFSYFVDYLASVFNLSRVSIMIFDPVKEVLKIKAAHGMPKQLIKEISVKSGEGVAGAVYQKGQAIFFEGYKKALANKGRYQSNQFLSLPLVVSPLRLGEEKIGVVNLADPRDDEGFSKEDMEILGAMNAGLANVIRLQQVMQEQLRLKTQEQEFKIIREMQESLLPNESPNHPLYQLDAFCELGAWGGGDYFDYHEEKALGLLADVSGHQSNTALLTAILRNQFRSSCEQKSNLKDLYQAIDAALMQDLQNLEKFISLWLFALKDKSVNLLGAGIPEALHFGKKKFKKSYLADNLPLGIKKQSHLKMSQVVLKSGETLILLSDGFLDPRHTGKNDIQSWIEFIEKRIHKKVSELKKDIQKRYKKSIRNLENPDDLVVFLIRRK